VLGFAHSTQPTIADNNIFAVVGSAAPYEERDRCEADPCASSSQIPARSLAGQSS